MLAVIAGEPLRESAYAMLIDAHLGQGNKADARWHLLTFARELWSELNVHPSPELLGKLGISSGRLTHFLSSHLPRYRPRPARRCRRRVDATHSQGVQRIRVLEVVPFFSLLGGVVSMSLPQLRQ